jgi:hypothetical protein
VVHTGGGRRRGKGRPRILYWFRTPPGIRIGRSALDESAIKLIEEHNPDVEFDWTRILKSQDAPVEQRPAPQERRGKPRSREFPPHPSPRVSSTDGAFPESDSPDESSAPPAVVAIPDRPDEAVGTDVEDIAAVPADVSEPAAWPAPTGQDQSPGVDEAAIEELLSDSPASIGKTTAEGEPTTAAQARLGSEGLSRLRARHAEVLARISETVTDLVRRDELKSQAERINPDTWVTDSEVSEGLEAYETVFESMRTVVGRRRRRRRRSGSGGGQPAVSNPGQNASSSDSAGAEEADADDTGEDL